MGRDNWSKQMHVIREKYFEWVFEMNQYKGQKSLISDISRNTFFLRKEESATKKNLDRKAGVEFFF